MAQHQETTTPAQNIKRRVDIKALNSIANLKSKTAKQRWVHLSRTFDVKSLIQQVLEMNSQYIYVVSILSKPPNLRQQFECEELVGWFKSRVQKIFHNLKTETITDVIRNCKFERKKANSLIIKQGEIGEKMFIVLKGLLSIYVQELLNDVDQLNLINSMCNGEFLEDRSILGEYKASTGASSVVGELALIKKDCVRIASVVVDEETDLIVIDQELYNRSVRETLERDYIERRKFVLDNPLFKGLTHKVKRQLIICLKKESYQYGNTIVRQGSPLEKTYFILEGEVEVIINPTVTCIQYKAVHEDIKFILPQLISQKRTMKEDLELMDRKRSNKRQLCLLGANEHIGLMEHYLGVGTYIETAITTRPSHLMVLEKRHEDIFLKKTSNGLQSNEHFQNVGYFRLSLYAHHCPVPDSSSIFKYFLLKLQDESMLIDLRKQKSSTPKKKQVLPNNKISKEESGNKNRIGISNIQLSRMKQSVSESFEKELERQNTEKIILSHVEQLLFKWKVNTESK
ncbi:cGMP-dependent protein kinase egl-4-like [Argonauta hians]